HVPRGRLGPRRVLAGTVLHSALPDVRQVVQGLSLEAVLLRQLTEPVQVEVVLIEHSHGLSHRPDVVFLSLTLTRDLRHPRLVEEPARDRPTLPRPEEDAVRLV